MSHTIPSRELAGLPIPIVAIEREDKHICSVNTDNYMGGYQAAGLLAKCSCDILFHINSPCSEAIPASGRIWGFTGFCEEHGLRNKLILREFGHVHEDVKAQMTDVLELLETAYSGLKKGIFVSSDTLANILLNLLFRKYGKLPDDYLIVGFDNSLISREAVIPISTVGQQIDRLAYEAVSLLVEQMEERKKRKPVPLKEPIHKIITPVLYRRETTG